MNTVLVIIVTYNAHHWIRQCVESIDMRRYDVFVVDNCSADDTLRILEEYPHIIVRSMTKNVGFGQANNIGLCYAVDNGYDYVLLLNQDAWLLPNTIKKLIATQQQYPFYWILSPMQMNTERGGLEWQFEKYLKCFQSREDVDVVSVPFMNAALWLMPISCVKIVGGFDSLFPHYGEDNDYANRVRYFGGKIGIDTKAVAYHERKKPTSPKTDQLLYKTTLTYLNVLKNINCCLFLSILMMCWYYVKHLLKFVIRGQFKEAQICTFALKACLKQLNIVQQHRHQSKQNGAFLYEL